MAQNNAFAFDQLRQGMNHLGLDSPHKMNRYMGGHARKNKPHITGYWYFLMIPPQKIFYGETNTQTQGVQQGVAADIVNSIMGSSRTQNTNGDVANSFDALRWLHSTAESFTPPNTSISKVDIPGMGGLSSSYMAGRENTRTFTVSFREYKDLPIMRILRLWTSVFDPYQGVSPLLAEEWIPESYKGVAIAYLCKPTVSNDGRNSLKHASVDGGYDGDIEQIYVFDGVWPESAPDDAFSNNISTNESVELSVTFSFDGSFYNKDLINIEEDTVKLFNDNLLNLDDTISYIESILPDSISANGNT